MGEKFSKFIEVFDARAAELIAKSKTKLDKFTKAREAALELKTPVNDQYKTLGDLIKEMVPESGILNDDLFRSVYANLQLNKEDKVLVSELFKVKNAPSVYEKAIKLKEKGGAAYLDELMQEIGKTMASSGLSFDEVIGKSAADFSEFLNAGIENLPDAAVELSNPELYAAVIENGNPLKKKEETGAAGTINEAAEKKASPASSGSPAGSAVNPEKAVEPIKTEVESTAGQVTSTPLEVPAELEKKEKQSININVETPNSPASSPVSPAGTSTFINQENQSTTNVQNVSSTSKEEVTQTQNNLTNQGGSTSQVTQAGATTVSQINDMSSQKKEETVNKIGKVDFITEQAIRAAKQFGLSDEEISKLVNSSSVNQPSVSSKPTETSASNKVINSSSVINDEEFGESPTATGSTVNETKTSPMFSDAEFAALASTAEKYGINVDEFKKARAEGQAQKIEDEEVTNQASALPQTIEVSKAQQTFPKEKKAEPLAQKAVEMAQSAAPSIEVKEKTASSPTEPPMNQATAPTQSAGPTLDLTSLENRLMRIEYLLSNTLDVKIIE